MVNHCLAPRSPSLCRAIRQCQLARHASTTSAINAGLRATRDGTRARASDGKDRRSREDDHRPSGQAHRNDFDRRPHRDRSAIERQRRPETSRFDQRETSYSSRAPRDRSYQPDSTHVDGVLSLGRRNDAPSTRNMSKGTRVASSRFSRTDDNSQPRRRSTGVDESAKPRRSLVERDDDDDDFAPYIPSNKFRPETELPARFADLVERPFRKWVPSDEASIPVPIPYTTASSQFLYGFNTIYAALRAQRRKLFKLYIADGKHNLPADRKEIVRLATAAQVEVVFHAETRLLDRISNNRAHNGIVLEASPLAVSSVYALDRIDSSTDSSTALTLIHQDSSSSADEQPSSGTVPPTKFSLGNLSGRQPLVLMLDGILDEGNLGNILRTAHFFGVDAVAVATNTCAPLTSPVALKASSGAAEALRLLSLPKPSDFIWRCRNLGWRIIASVAPDDARTVDLDGSRMMTDEMRGTGLSSLGVKTAESSKGGTGQANADGYSHEDVPTILMLGAESDGLRANLLRRAHLFLSIGREDRDAQITPDVGVDSLNVGAAASVLLDTVLRAMRAERAHSRAISPESAHPASAPEENATQEEEEIATKKMW